MTSSAMTPSREDLSAHTEDELVALAAGGRHDAFEAIMRRHNQRLFRAARAILGQDADAEDAVQDAYLKAYQRLDGFQARSSLSTWLCRIVINEALQRLRARRASAAIDSVSGGVEMGSNVIHLPNRDGSGPEDMAGNRELRRLLETAIDELPDTFRLVFLMREVEGMSVAEIADALSIPESTVKTRAFRARRELRCRIENELEPVKDGAFTFLGARCDRMVSRVLEQLRGIDTPRRHRPP